MLRRLRSLPRTVYALGAVSLLNDAASEMVVPLLPLFLVSTLGAGPVVLGAIEGAADAAASLLKLFVGRWSDRVGRRKPFVVAGYALAGIARPLTSLAGSAGAVLGIRLADRTGKGLRTSPRDALLAAATPTGLHATAFGVHEAMDHAGAVLGPLLAFGLLSAGMGLRGVFALAAIPAVAALAVVIFAVRDRVDAEAARPATAARAGSADLTSPDPASPSAAAATAAPAPVPRAFRIYLFAIVVFSLANASDAFLLLRASDAGLPGAALPLLWALHHVVKAVVAAPGGVLADRIGRRRAVALGWIVYALSYVGFGFADGPLEITGWFVVYGLHFGLCGGAQKALVGALAPASRRGWAFGLYHASIGLAALPASLAFGFLYQSRGPAAAFLVAASLALLAAAVLPFTRTAAPAPRSGASQKLA